MLLEFTLGNYRSFREDKTLSMLSTKLKARDPRLNENNRTQILPGKHVLHSAAVFGGNASGKSNLVRAIGTMRRLIIDSAREGQVGDTLPTEPFLLHDDYEEEPSLFEAVFVIDGTRYRYGFEIDRRSIRREWLFHVPKGREARLFEREEQDFRIRPDFMEEGGRLSRRTRENALFLSVCAQFNGTVSSRILGWFKSIWVLPVSADRGLVGVAARILKEDGKEAPKVRALMRVFDLGFTDLKVVPKEVKGFEREILSMLLKKVISENGDWDGPSEDEVLQDQVAILTEHRKFSGDGQDAGTVSMSLSEHESDGTQKLFGLSVALSSAFSEGRLVVIDEFDARLHPLLGYKLVELFHRPEINVAGGQLLLTTHDTSLLRRDLFRRDQVWFIEKNRQGASDLYSLAQFGPRNDSSFHADYIGGRYGAIPFLGRLDGIDLRGEGDEDK